MSLTFYHEKINLAKVNFTVSELDLLIIVESQKNCFWGIVLAHEIYVF